MQFQQRILAGKSLPTNYRRIDKLQLAHSSTASLLSWLPGRQSKSRCLQGKLKPLKRNSTNIYSSDAATASMQQETTVTGRWKKSSAQSDDMTLACDLVELSWVLRRALGLLDILEVKDSQETFETKIKAGGILDVTERYSWSGAVTEHKRRDKRRGIHHGRVLRTENGPQISVDWEDPFGGHCEDTFQISADNQTLTQVTEMKMDTGKTCKYRIDKEEESLSLDGDNNVQVIRGQQDGISQGESVSGIHPYQHLHLQSPDIELCGPKTGMLVAS